MIRIGQLKLSPEHTEAQLRHEIERVIKYKLKSETNYQIIKKSIDARKKEDIKIVYTIDIEIPDKKVEKKISRYKNVMFANCADKYKFPGSGKQQLNHRPVVVGSGPAGLFCGYLLAREGYRPIIIERGGPAHERQQAVECFWNGGALNLQSNVQFGEGGAGTFSDGKLNTLVKDKSGRNRFVLETFVGFGANPDILWWNKPHIGTDVLIEVVQNMRNEIIRLGGEVRFYNQLTDIFIENSKVTGVEINGSERLDTEVLVLAIGHSARDTFEMLFEKAVPMAAKPFAVGVRVEHPQCMIQEAQYGEKFAAQLPPASYKLTANLPEGRSVYSFCMCPGGYVVNASSEQNRLAVNGMSYQNRAGKNANSAIIVSVRPEDFGEQHPLAGMHFQRELEERAYRSGSGKVPVQLYQDFCRRQKSSSLGEIEPSVKGEWAFGNVHEIFPEHLQQALELGMASFGRKISGFDRPDCLLLGVESRTSSPVRIWREEDYSSSIKGIYPCGEGAGYAGGITSAAMDGIRSAEKIGAKYAIVS